MKGKIFGVLVLLIVGILAVSGIVSAAQTDTSGSLGVNIDSVEVDDTEVDNSTINYLDLEKGEEFKIKVVITGIDNISDVQIEAYMRGYDHDDRIEDITDVFDVRSGVSYSKKLILSLPSRMDQDEYMLRVRVESRSGDTKYADYKIKIEAKRHLLQIKDIVLSPENEVKVGRALLTTVRVKNIGTQDEEGIKIKVSIPELGISASDYVDELEKEGDDDDETTSEELYMRIPENAEEGDYAVKVEVVYDDGDEKETAQTSIRVVKEEGTTAAAAQPETVLTLLTPTAQDVAQGESVYYSLTVKNNAATAKAYTLSVSGADNFAAVSITPENTFVLDSGAAKTVYVNVNALKTASAGAHVFSLSATGLDSPISLTANVKAAIAAGGLSVKRVLEVGLVILVVLLVILGLIIGFNKMKGSEEDTEEAGKTYY